MAIPTKRRFSTEIVDPLRKRDGGNCHICMRNKKNLIRRKLPVVISIKKDNSRFISYWVNAYVISVLCQKCDEDIIAPIKSEIDRICYRKRSTGELVYVKIQINLPF